MNHTSNKRDLSFIKKLTMTTLSLICEIVNMAHPRIKVND